MMSLGLLLGPGPAEKHVKGGTRSRAEKAIDESLKKARGSFEREYQRWYTEASAVIRQLIPDRTSEFEHLYKGDGKRKEVNNINYTIQDWLNGVRSAVRVTGEKFFNDSVIVSSKFNTQLEILRSVEARFDTSLFDI